MVNEIALDKIFIINRSKLEERLEPKYYTGKYIGNEERLKQSKFPLKYLTEVTSLISDGTHFTPVYCDTGVKFISVKDVREYEISFENVKFISEEEATLLDKRCKPQRSDILLTKIGSYGYAALVDTEERFQLFVSVALLRPNQLILPKFLEVFLNTELAHIQFERVIKGAGVPDLHLEDIRKVKIPLPPKDVQKAIVVKFEESYRIAKQKEAEAQKLTESIDGYLLDALGVRVSKRDSSLPERIFTVKSSDLEMRIDPLFYNSDLTIFNSGDYEKVKIGTVGSLKSGIGAGRQDQASAEDGIIQIRPTNIKDNGVLNFQKNVYIPKDLLTAGELLAENDVLFNNTNSQELVGKTAIVKSIDQELSFSNHITRIRVVDPMLSPDYLCIILNAYQRHKIFYSICTNWNNQSGVGLSLLSSLLIPYLPLEKQMDIVKHINDIQFKAIVLQEQAQALAENVKEEVEQMMI